MRCHFPLAGLAAGSIGESVAIHCRWWLWNVGRAFAEERLRGCERVARVTPMA